MDKKVVDALKAVGFDKNTVDSSVQKITDAESKGYEFRVRDLLEEIAQSNTGSIATNGDNAKKTLDALKTIGHAIDSSKDKDGKLGEKLVSDYNDYVEAKHKFDDYVKAHGTNPLDEELQQHYFKPLHDTVRTYQFALSDAVTNLSPNVLKAPSDQAPQR